MIELRAVNFAYDGVPALKNISLTICKGEAVALLGANGCGKSTLLKLLNGVVFAQSGAYAFCGDEITAKKMRDSAFSKPFHQKIGFLFQNAEFQLFCANVFDEIAFGPRQMGMAEDQVLRRVDDCLTLLNIKPLAQRRPYHLSDGEKRKVALASVLALNPEVLTLDEPLNGLDPRTQRWLVGLLIRLRQAGKTLITSTHNIELVHEISSRAILFYENHTIAADLPTQDLLGQTTLLQSVNLISED